MKKNQDYMIELPSANMKLDPSSHRIMEATKIKKFIGPFIARMLEQKVRRIGLFSWDSEESTRLVGQIMAVAMNQQMEQRCALVITEGVRISSDNYDTFSLVTLPEVDAEEFTEKADAYRSTMDRNFPLQIFVGPPLKTWSPGSSERFKTAMSTDAQILLVPERGLPRRAMLTLETFTRSQKARWFGVLTMTKENSNG